MNLRLCGVHRHRDIAIDVATGRQGVHQGRIDRLHRGFQLGLNHAVKLQCLTRGDAQAARGESRRNRIQLQPLRRRNHAARGAGANHEAKFWLQLGQTAFFTHVTVVLLIAAVIFDDGLIGLAQCTSDLVVQALLNLATQLGACLLDFFDRIVGTRH